MSFPLWSWFAVGGLIAVLLAVDIATSRGRRGSTWRRAVVASAAWVAVSVAFGAVLGATSGSGAAEQYFAGYLLEKSLSVDNVFVFVLLFGALAVPAALQHRVLYFGVVGALVMRAGFIAGGVVMIERFAWVLYVFGAVLVTAGVRMARGAQHVKPDGNVVVNVLRQVVPVTERYEGDRFFSRSGGRWAATPLLVALIAIETTDLVFAADSIPAVFGVTRNLFIVLTSNAFAVLGLRALYFVFAGAAERFAYLKYGLAVLLVFIGAKMLLAPVVHLPVLASLGVIVAVVAGSMLASVHFARRPPTPTAVRVPAVSDPECRAG
ncbi:MAG: TerC/Alx family metal homeostasis membrane protein [Acidimicrobiales bacterium]